ncbi:hypothetical protein SynBMKMC1_00295 [Synechococcus sp. BMK-MC-1]|nr:hypothetical protein SynBMKMC1_00295 [Synechococcus sp. BMK-MC-1]
MDLLPSPESKSKVVSFDHPWVDQWHEAGVLQRKNTEILQIIQI